MLPIKSGRLNKPVKAVIYGLEGTGKSTLAAQTPNPLFLDTEGGTTYLDVSRIDQFTGWEGLLNTIEEVARDTSCCSTLVIDTADWAEQMAIKHICEKYKQPAYAPRSAEAHPGEVSRRMHCGDHRDVRPVP